MSTGMAIFFITAIVDPLPEQAKIDPLIDWTTGLWIPLPVLVRSSVSFQKFNLSMNGQSISPSDASVVNTSEPKMPAIDLVSQYRWRAFLESGVVDTNRLMGQCKALSS